MKKVLIAVSLLVVLGGCSLDVQSNKSVPTKEDVEYANMLRDLEKLKDDKLINQISDNYRFGIEVIEILREVRDITTHEDDESKTDEYNNRLFNREIKDAGEEIDRKASKWLEHENELIAESAYHAKSIAESFTETAKILENGITSVDQMDADIKFLREKRQNGTMEMAIVMAHKDPDQRLKLTKEEKGKILEKLNLLFKEDFEKFDKSDNEEKKWVILEPELFSALAIRKELSQ